MASTRKYPTAAVLAALSDAEDPDSGFLHMETGETPHSTTELGEQWFVQQQVKLSDQLRVYKDDGGELEYGVNAGRPMIGGVAISYAGASGQALTDDADNYIFLNSAGTLTINTTGFPVGTCYLPLATIATGSESALAASGYYDFADITDYRGEAIFEALNPSAAQFEMIEDFAAASGATPPAPWATNTQSGNETADYVDDELTGIFQLALEGTDEAQAAQLTWGDQLMIDTDKDAIVEFDARIDGIADMTSVEQTVLGLCSAHANAEDSLDNTTTNCWFLLKAGGLDIYMEADDGTNDTNDTDTGINMADDTWTTFRIDMSDLTAVKMFVDGVEASATLNMTQAAGLALQPIGCAQRADNSQAEVGFQVEIDRFRVVAKR